MSYDAYLMHVYTHSIARRGCEFCYPPPLVSFGPSNVAPFSMIESIRIRHHA